MRSWGVAEPWNNAFYSLEILEDKHVVRLIRTAEPFNTVFDMINALEEILAQIEDVDGKEYGLYVDGRLGPQRDDEGFRDAFRAFRQKLDQRFARVGVVLGDDGGETSKALTLASNVMVFADEDKAMRWAANELTEG